MRAGLGVAAACICVLLVVVLGLGSCQGQSNAATSCVGAAVATGKVPNGWAKDVQAAAAVAGVPAPVLAAQLNQESGWNPKAKSPAGADGLAQFIPGTAEQYGLEDPFDPKAAIAAQGRYMKALMAEVAPIAKRVHGDAVEFALAGYNAGAGAVQMFSGIPPYAETQSYVKAIMASAKSYTAAGSSGSSSATPADGACGGDQASPTGKADDLPWKSAPTWTQVGLGPAAQSPLGFYNRECVDFAMWRVNEELGTAHAPYKYTNSTLTPDGSALGSASRWKVGWQKKGWPVSSTPQVGATSWYAAGAPGADPQNGHVGKVLKTYGNGTIVEEGYNLLPDHDHGYYTRTIAATYPTAYLYVPKGGKK